MSDHLLQMPVLIFAGMMILFTIGMVFVSVDEALNSRH